MKLIKFKLDYDAKDELHTTITVIIGFVIVSLIILLLMIINEHDINNFTIKSNDYSSRFTRIESSALRDSYDVVYDNETKVMYTVSYKGEFTVLLNADGTPLLYEGE